MIKIPTLYSDYKECILDLDIYGKIVATPLQSIQELTDTLFEEFKRRKPMPTLEHKRYELSRMVSPDYRIAYNRELEMQDNESLIDLENNISSLKNINFEDLTPLIPEVKEAFSYEMNITDAIRDDIIAKYDLSTGEEFKPGIAETEGIVGSTSEDETTILTDEEIEELGVEQEVSDLIDDSKEEISDTELEVSDIEVDEDFVDYDSDEDDNFGLDSDNFDEDDSEEVSEDDSSEDGLTDYDNEEESEEDTSEEYDESDSEDDIDVYDFDEEESEEDGLTDYDNDSDEEESEEDDLTDYDNDLDDEDDYGLDSDEEDDLAVYDNDSDEVSDDSESKDVGLTFDLINSLDDGTSDFDMEFIEKDDTLHQDDSGGSEPVVDKVVQTPITPVEIHNEVREQVIIDRTAEPTDLRAFIRKHPRCEYKFALQYFTKKQIDDAVKIGKVIKKGNILKI